MKTPASRRRRAFVGAFVVSAVAAVLSAVGIATAAASAEGATCQPVSAGTHEYTMTVDGQQRSYAVWVPQGWDPSAKVPVVYFFHGRDGDAAGQMWASKLPSQADQDGFLVVAPQAKGSPIEWDGARDATFIGQLKDRIASDFCVDTSREYAVGYSDGALATATMACNDFGGFEGYGGTAAMRWYDGCSTSSGFTYVSFNGTADPYAPFDGDAQVPPVASSAYAMARADGCSTADPNSVTDVAPGVTLFSWTSCRDGHHIDVYVMWGAGHIWPGADYLADLGPQAQISAPQVFADTFGLSS